MGLHKIETTCKITDFIQELKSSDKGMKIYFLKTVKWIRILQKFKLLINKSRCYKIKYKIKMPESITFYLSLDKNY